MQRDLLENKLKDLKIKFRIKKQGRLATLSGFVSCPVAVVKYPTQSFFRQ